MNTFSSRLTRVALAAASATLTTVLAVPAFAQGDATPPAPAPADPAPAPAAAPAPAPEPAGPSGAPEAAPAAPVSAAPAKDEAQAAKKPDEKEEKKLPFRGSTFLFDQSLTTQTAQLETSPQQSYVPTYEWWFSFRPRWYFTDKLSYSLRADYYKEFTNSNNTTQYREDVFGDIWNTVGYKTPLATDGTWKNTKVSVYGRALLPTSKDSQAAGVYVTAGAGGGVEQKFNINGESAKFFNDAHIGLSAGYSHPFSRATTPTSNDFQQSRQDTEGRSFLSDQVRGSMLANHQVLGILDTGISITPKLSLSLDMITINAWKYAPKDSVNVQTATGNVAVPRNSDSTLFTESTWFIGSLDYDIIDEVSLGVGYYNLANLIAPNGVRRGLVGGDNIWWSPDARVFFDITANLDKIYEAVAGAREDKSKPLNRSQQRTSESTPSGQKNAQRMQQL